MPNAINPLQSLDAIAAPAPSSQRGRGGVGVAPSPAPYRPDPNWQMRGNSELITAQIQQLWKTFEQIIDTGDLHKIESLETLIGNFYQQIKPLLSQADLEPPLSKVAAKKFDVDGAKKEIRQKDGAAIERDTAFKWASRSMAAYELFNETKDLKWLLRAEDYFGESREHAAKAADEGKTLISIEKAVLRYENRLPDDLKFEIEE